MDSSHPPSAHRHDHGSSSTPTHSHGPASPHPAQAVSWSILRMTVAARLGAALVVSACLWAMVWIVTR